jgi:hypothetical protein
MLETELAMQDECWYGDVAQLSCKATIVLGPEGVLVVRGTWCEGFLLILLEEP